jgi:AcrR family transcriptional regulator
MTSIQDGRALRQQNIYDENKLKLIDTAIDVINEVGDIKEITLSQIAREAGVSPATAYNHFPDRMSDLYASIAKTKLDVRDTFMEIMSDDSMSLMDTIVDVPKIYAQKMVDLGYTGQVLVSEMANLQAAEKWLEDDPVTVFTNLLVQEGTHKNNAKEIAEKIVTTFRGAMFEYSLHRTQLNNQYSAYSSERFLEKCSMIVEDVFKQY